MTCHISQGNNYNFDYSINEHQYFDIKNYYMMLCQDQQKKDYLIGSIC